MIITKVSKSAGWIAQKIVQRWSTSKTIAEITQQGFRGFLARIALRFHTRPGPYFSPLPPPFILPACKDRRLENNRDIAAPPPMYPGPAAFSIRSVLYLPLFLFFLCVHYVDSLDNDNGLSITYNNVKISNFSECVLISVPGTSLIQLS